MTYDEALDFFAKYGNVAGDPDRLRNSMPTPSQLKDAAIRATQPPFNQPNELAQEAALAVANQMELMEEPKDQSVVRKPTVNRMIELWEKGEVYTFPYTRAEVRAAEQRWVKEEWTCSSIPKRVPWAGEKP